MKIILLNMIRIMIQIILGVTKYYCFLYDDDGCKGMADENYDDDFDEAYDESYDEN